MRIPRIIHLIWVGNLRMRTEYIDTMLNWARKNPNFQVYLWVDKHRTSADVFDYYNTYFPQRAVEISQSKASRKKETSDFFSRIKIKDITEEKITDEYIRYEIDRLHPNYGAASDLIRYQVLYKHGGVYFDTDVTEGKRSLTEATEIFDENYREPQLWIQIPTEFQGNPGADIPNDTFICTPQHPMMQQMLDIAHQNYQITDMQLSEEYGVTPLKCFQYNPLSQTANQTYASDTQDFIRNATILRTGPALLRRVMLTEPVRVSKFLHRPISLTVSELTPGDLRCADLVSKAEWLKRGIQPKLVLQDVINRAVATILFDIKKIGVLRLDDNIKQVVELFPDHRSSELAVAIINEIRRFDINYQDIQGAQLTFNYPETEEFYRGKGLLDRTFLFPLAEEKYQNNFSSIDYCTTAIYAASCEGELTELSISVTSWDAESSVQAGWLLTRGITFLENLLDRYKNLLSTGNEGQNQVINKVLGKKGVGAVLKTYESFLDVDTIDKDLKNRIHLLSDRLEQICEAFPSEAPKFG